MRRNKPYGVAWGIFECLLLFFSGGWWLLVIIPREIRRWS